MIKGTHTSRIWSGVLTTTLAIGLSACDGDGEIAVGGGGDASDGFLLLSAADGQHGVEPWVSDGTADGTELLRDINASGGSSNPEGFTRVGDRVIFTAVTASEGRELWVTDGTTGNTQLLMDIHTGQGDGVDTGQAFPVVNGYAYFRANDPNNGGEALWRTDGTAADTQLVSDSPPGDAAANSPGNMVAFDGEVFFAATDGNGSALWASDGTDNGTRRIQQFNSNSSLPEHFTVAGGSLYFTVTNDTNGSELWVTDGSSGGAVMLEAFDGFADGGIAGLEPYNQGVAFFADNGSDGLELWTSRGTDASTDMVDNAASGVDSLVRSDFVPFAHDGTLYFAADDTGTDWQLWTSNGSVGGPDLLKTINPNGVGLTTTGDDFTVLNDVLYFSARNDTDGYELYRTDGTLEGTFQVKDINTNGPSAPSDMVTFNGSLIFSADGGTGRELWISNGTEAGTLRLKEINNSGDANVDNIAAFE